MQADALRRLSARVQQPVRRQALLLVLVALDAAMHEMVGGTFGSFYAAGLGLLLLTTAWTVVASSTSALPAGGTAVMVLDLAGVGLMRLLPDGSGLGFLAVLIALWLGMDLRYRGVLISLAGIIVLVTLPSLVYFGADGAAMSRALLLPVTAVVCAMATAGAAQAWAGQNRELEEQGRRLEQALEAVVANRALNDAIVSTVDVGLVALNRSGGYCHMNPRHTIFMELAFPDGHDGVAGQHGYVYAADRKTRLSRDEMPSMRVMQGEEFADYVIWVGQDPDRQRALSVSARLVFDNKGEFDGAVLVYKDITDLMSALKVKDEFVASVSHELRTPLTVIRGYLDLVLEGSGIDGKVKQHLQVVRRNADRLLHMVDDLLLAAHFEQGRLIVDRRDTELAGLVTEAVADHGPRAEAAGITVEFASRGPAVVAGDQVRLRQVVDNLLSNAIKYTPSGGAVSVLLEPRGSVVELVVTDSGIGISAEDRQRLFTRFFRSPQAEAMAIPGVGLGLAITRAIVESHHGSIELESEVGRGSTFRVRLPLHTMRDLVAGEPDRSGAVPKVSANPAFV